MYHHGQDAFTCRAAKLDSNLNCAFLVCSGHGHARHGPVVVCRHVCAATSQSLPCCKDAEMKLGPSKCHHDVAPAYQKPFTPPTLRHPQGATQRPSSLSFRTKKPKIILRSDYPLQYGRVQGQSSRKGEGGCEGGFPAGQSPRRRGFSFCSLPLPLQSMYLSIA